MNALTKFSIALLLVTAMAIAVYLYVAPSDESYDDTGSQSGQSQPQDAICKQDEQRLARLRAKPSLDEGLRFVSEIRCLQLWPQLQTVMDGLTNPSRSTAASGPAGSDTTAGRDDARQTESPAAGAASAALDDACRHDEDRLAELQANPSVDAAIRFDSELRCPRLQPQLPAILKRLSGAAASIAAQNRAAPTSQTLSASEPAPPASAPPDMEVTSASDDACRRDEDRLAELQAKPSLDEAVRFEGELKCSKLQPQLLAILDGLSRAPEAPPPAASHGPAGLESTGEAAPAVPAQPPSEPSGSETTFASVPQDAGAKKTATNEAPPASQAATDGERRIAELESEKEALDAKVSQLERDREASSAEEAAPRQQPAPVEEFQTQPDSQTAADAQRRIAQLERENEALAAEVSQLQHDRETAAAEQTNAASLPLPSAAPKQSENQPASQAAADAERRIAELENEKEALAAKVSQFEHERQASPAEQAAPAPSPPPAAPAEWSYSAQAAALASLPEGMPARVLIRYLANNAEARAQAEKLANALATQGVEVADLRESASAIRTELSFSYAPDEGIAQQVGRLVGVAPVRRLQPKDGLMARPGTVELSLSGASHLAAVKTTSSRESHHE